MVNNLEKEGCYGTKTAKVRQREQHLMAIRKAMAERGTSFKARRKWVVNLWIIFLG